MRDRLVMRALAAIGASALMLGCPAAGPSLSSVLGSAASGSPSLPRPGPLAQPRSLQQVRVPVEATRATIPRDNPQTLAKIALGQGLFFDPRLSADGTVACSTCHDPARAFTEGRPTSVGINGRVGQRNAPTVLNAL